MNDPQLVTALRARSAETVADLFDAYGQQLFRYCWGMLRSREVAKIALRDTLIVAAANIALLADAELLGPWLYSLARAECRQRRALPAAQADEPPARPSQADAEARLVAWNAAMSLAAVEFEALDLACRHQVDVGLVLGLPARDVRDLLGRARLSLQQALGAEILITKGNHDCPDRAEVMHGWTGTITPELRERVLLHAADCPVCGPNLPRSVSAERVFALMPDPALPPGARAEVLGFFSDPRMSGYREFAVTRAPELAGSGFPVTAGIAPQQAPGAPGLLGADRAKGSRDAQRVAAVTSGTILPAAAAIAVAALMAAAFMLGSGTQTADRLTDSANAAASPSGSGTATSVPIIIKTSAAPAASQGRGGTGESGRYAGPATGPKPRPVRSSAALSGPPGAGPGSARSLTVTSGRLALGAGSVGTISITVVGGPVNWAATTTSKQLTLSSYHGTLRAEQSITLVVTVHRVKDTGGTAAVYIDPVGAMDQAVGVTWAPQSVHSASLASPSASASPSPPGSTSKAPVSPSASSSPSPSASPSPSNGTVLPSPPPSGTPNPPSSVEVRLQLSV